MHNHICRLTAATLALGLVSSCDGPTESPAASPGIHVTAKSMDTVSTTQTMTVQVADTAGRPGADVAVILEVQPESDYYYPYWLFIARSDSQPFNTQLTDTTDARGSVSLRLRFGVRAGVGRLVIRAPSFGFADTIRFTIMPGALDGVTVFPTDTAIYATHGYTLRATATDQFGNSRSDPVSFAVAYGPASADQRTGAVTATAIGRAALVAQAGGHNDTAYVSVVPSAWVATQQFDPGNGGPIGLFLIQLDGSGKQRLAPGLDNSFIPQGFGWSPDGRELALVRGNIVSLLVPGDTERVLVRMSNPIVTATRFSRDGEWVYFSVEYSDLATEPEGLYRVRVDGTGLEHLGRGSRDAFASPSPDGLSLVYVNSVCYPYCIRILDLTTNQDRMYGGQDVLARGFSVAWSPTEDLIAYDSGSNLMLVHSDGSGARALRNDVSHVKWMDWSPDGRWLVVAETGVIVIDVQTGLKLPIGQLGSYGATAWRP